MPFERIFTDIWDEYRTRARYRIVSSYVLSFAMWNWYDLAILLFDDHPYWMKAEALYFKLDTDSSALFVPLGFALIWIYGVPAVNWLLEKVRIQCIGWMDESLRVGTVKLIDKRLREENEKLLEDINKMGDEIAKLNTTIQEYDSREKDARAKLYRHVNQYLQYRNKLITEVYSAKRRIQIKDLDIDQGLHQTQISAAISELIEKYEAFNSVSTRFLEEDIRVRIEAIRDHLRDLKENQIAYAEVRNLDKVKELKKSLWRNLNELEEKIDAFIPNLNDAQLRLGPYSDE